MPQVWDVSSGLAQGISGAGRGLAAGLEAMGDRRKTEASEAATIRKLMSIYDPENKDRYTVMGLPELRGEAQGIALKQAREQQTKQQNFQRAIMGIMGGSAPGAPVRDPGPAGLMTEDSPVSRPNVGTDAPPANGFQPQDLMRAAAASGVLTPEMAMKMMQEGVNWEELKPREFTTGSGVRGVYGKGGQFQFDPSQFMPAGGEAPEGYTMVPGRGGQPQYLRDPAQKEVKIPNKLQDEFTDLMKTVNATRTSADPKAKERLPRLLGEARQLVDRYHKLGEITDSHRDAYYDDLGIKPPASAAPATPSERVTVSKDGKEFTLPRSQLAAAKKQGYTEVPAK